MWSYLKIKNLIIILKFIKGFFNHSANNVYYNIIKLFVASLLFIASSSIAVTKNFKTHNQSTLSFFIQFQPGIYKRFENKKIDYVLQKINENPYQTIYLVGLSQSANSFATLDLALVRAETVKKTLVAMGINPERIIVSGEYENFLMPDNIAHGVFINIDTTKSPNNPTINSLIDTTRKTGFIPFSVGVYNKPKANLNDMLVTKLLALPNNVKLRLIGISQSKSNLASKTLGLKRAQTIADELIIRGIAPERIKIDAEITNFVKDYYLTHGVHIYAEAGDINNETAKIISAENLNTSSSSSSSSSIPIQTKPIDKQQALNNVIEQLNQSISSDPYLDNKILKVSQPENANKLEKITKTDANIDLCKQLIINKGSLKKNIEREIADCGYLMGEWKFGTDEELIDWLIPISYRVEVGNGIFGILKLIEKNYQIRAHVHKLDKSIDFLASIKREKDQ